MLASVIISTYNRADALPQTLEALARQDVPPSEYEVLVVDDGSTDQTPRTLAAVSVPYSLRIFRLPVNRGVSAGRNVGLRNAKGQYIIMISDDLIVPPSFIAQHVNSLRRFPDAWVVGGFKQLESLTATPFGRFLDALEKSFDLGRTGPRVDTAIYEMTTPTARNLSIPRAHLDNVGLFDEQFRVTCEDQDLAERARQKGIRFLYDASLSCVHNDQAASLARYCRFQQRGARDTVRLCAKYPQLHGGAEIARADSYVMRSDGIPLISAKLVKNLASRSWPTSVLERLVALAEQLALPDRLLHRAYRALIGLYTFRGFREGLRETGGQRSPLMRYLRQRRGTRRQ